MKIRGWIAVSVLLCAAGCVSAPVAEHRADAILEPTVAIVVGPPTIEYRDVESDTARLVLPADHA